MQFHFCSACEAVAYCGEPHQLQHWKAPGGHRAKCSALRRAGAKPPATN